LLSNTYGTKFEDTNRYPYPIRYRSVKSPSGAQALPEAVTPADLSVFAPRIVRGAWRFRCSGLLSARVVRWPLRSGWLLNRNSAVTSWAWLDRSNASRCQDPIGDGLGLP